MGIIGNTHGVNASSRPKPKKLAMSAQNPPLNNPAISASSDCALDAPAPGAAGRNGVCPLAAAAGVNDASTSAAVCSSGG